MKYIGIDPGLHGTLAIIDIWPENNKAILTYKYEEGMYTEVLRGIAECRENVKCCLEHVSAMPGNGSVSMFNFGANFGWIQGVLQALQIPYELVRPQRWKKEFGVTADKNSSVAVCKKLFPEVSLLPTARSRKDSADTAEAILMAEYARRRM